MSKAFILEESKISPVFSLTRSFCVSGKLGMKKTHQFFCYILTAIVVYCCGVGRSAGTKNIFETEGGP